jgi:eukaryotic-like serine/threonine-protein kinase
MGRVYEGIHETTGKKFAVKTPRIASAIFRSHLRAEYNNLIGLNHPFVVRVHMNGLDDEVPWYAMDLIDGPTLRYYIQEIQKGKQANYNLSKKNTPIVPSNICVPSKRRIKIEKKTFFPWENKDRHLMGLRWICKFFGYICEALHYLHSRGVVHADIKPDNIFVLDGKRPIMIDFGIASTFSLRSKDTLNICGCTTGTIAYSPLEQISGELLDPRADLYALGCTLFECLTGVQPFLRKSATETIAAKRVDFATPISVYRKNVPSIIEQLIHRLLARKPGKRIGHAVDVAAVLKRIDKMQEKGRNSTERTSMYFYRTPLIGREAIMKLLSHHMERLASGTGSGLLLYGETGVGKTRIANETVRIARKTGVAIIGLSCLKHPRLKPCMQDTTAYITGNILLNKFEENELINICMKLSEESRDISADRAAPTFEEDPDVERKNNVKSLLLKISKKKPILLVIDDFHLADTCLFRLVTDLVNNHLKKERILIVATACVQTGEDRKVPLLSSKMMSVPIKRMNDEQVCEQIGHMLAEDYLPKKFLSSICMKSKGAPRLVVKQLRAAVNAGVLSREGLKGWRVKLDG